MAWSRDHTQCIINNSFLFQTEGQGEEWHGHVTTLTVSAQFRRLGIAHTLMNELEKISEVRNDSYFLNVIVAIDLIIEQ